MEIDSKQIAKFSIFSVCTLFTMRTANMLPYNSISIYLVLGVLAGPVSAVLLYKKKYWLRAIVGVLAFTGFTGLAFLFNTYGGVFLYQEELFYSTATYLFHGIFSMLLTLVFVFWYYIIGRKENESGF